MSERHAIVRLKVQDGKLEEFKRLAVECMELVRTKDTGTLRYECFFAEDPSDWIVYESYRDSAAFLQHAANLRQTLESLFSLVSYSSEILGTPSPELSKALQGRNVRIYRPFRP